MKFTTAISTHTKDGNQIYGTEVSTLARSHTFTDTVFLLYAKRLPAEGERALMDALLSLSCEHGIEVPSLYVPHVSVASGNTVSVGIAAGILATGPVHGGAGSMCAQLLTRTDAPESIVQEHIDAQKRIPGFGHKVYKDKDPRASLLFEIASEHGIPLTYFERAGKRAPLNIDGAIAACVLAFGMPATAAEALFIISRVAGMGAHAIEEKEQGNSFYRLEESDIVKQ